MNAYDFDKTIYKGDSTIDFYLFCLKRNPKILKCLPKQVKGFLFFKLGKIDKTEFKELFFSFLENLKDIDGEVTLFWDVHEKRVKDWYRKKHRKDDVVISASPCFLLNEICSRLEIENLIASKVDKKTGKFCGKNCYGKEKVYRFCLKFGDRKPDEFYSDSYSDAPMSKIAKHSFIVKGDRIRPW